MKRALMLVALLPLAARAQPVVSVTVNAPEVEEPTPLPAPVVQPPVVIAQPPLVVIPPPPPTAFAGGQCAVPTTCDYLDDLERRGRAKKIAGGLMLGIGGAALIGGAVAAGWAAYDHGIGGSVTQKQHDDDGIIIGGALVSLLGGLSMLAAIPVEIVGTYQVNKARKLRLAPVIGMRNAGLAATF